MYRVDVESTGDGSLVRVFCKRTGKSVCVGGYEGMQRYNSSFKIKAFKTSVVCLNSTWESIGHISSYLTRIMHEEQGGTLWVGPNDVESGIRAVGESIGHMQFYGRGALPYADNEFTVEHIENTSISMYTITVPSKRGKFLVDRAKEYGLEKKDIIELNRGGRVEVEGNEYFLSDFLSSPTIYPEITVISIKRNINLPEINELIERIKNNSCVIVRMSTEVLNSKKKEIKRVSKILKLIEYTISRYSENSNISVYGVISTERESEKITDLHKKIEEFPFFIRPQFYDQKRQRHLRMHSTLRDGDSIDLQPIDSTLENNSLLHPKKENIPEKPITTTKSFNSPFVLFLGTGAAVPTPLRNVSSIYLKSKSSSFLLDCGEATISQVRRASLDQKLFYSHLHSVLLTHRHADHILGVFSVIRRANKEGNKYILLLGDKSIIPALHYFQLSCIFIENHENLIISSYKNTRTINITTEKQQLFSSISLEYPKTNIQLSISINITSPQDPIFFPINIPYTTTTYSNTPYSNTQLSNISSIRMCKANHIFNSYSYRVDTKENINFSISYSGDTLPNKEFSILSEKVDLMIHEATFEDEEIHKASSTKHSTVSGAIKVFKDSKASSLVLTHISQRYKALQVHQAYLAMDFFMYSPNVLIDQRKFLQEVQKWIDK
ncbi:ribonuclease Z [Nematocida sp. LUAm1]|nr:ribonuclease Z [Nematocida sp. LUAm2]KAI5178147.1 ribonuclease Z [Nematocida sp. LUAm1]